MENRNGEKRVTCSIESHECPQKKKRTEECLRSSGGNTAEEMVELLEVRLSTLNHLPFATLEILKI